MTQQTIRLDRDAAELCRGLRAAHPVCLWLDGGGSSDGWDAGPLLAIEPRVIEESSPTTTADALRRLEAIDRRVAARRRVAGGHAQTGVAVVLAFEALGHARWAGDGDRPARIVAVEVDRSLRFLGSGRALYSARAGAPRWGTGSARRAPVASTAPAARSEGPVRTSLPRRDYLAAVARVQREIADGEIYQANVCQVFRGRVVGDPCRLFERVRRQWPAPRSAFLDTGSTALVSLSPEIFLRLLPPDRIQTWPIKGTRPRGSSVEADRRAREELERSAKDRAELLMIVDLERNDLGRVCRTGSVTVPRLAAVRSFATVHHLVACVEGRLRPEVGVAQLVRATFPGGSISGAPKGRALEVLGQVEPVPRGWFTGSLCWLGDDGSMDSSILIRSVTLHGGEFALGAGGGIVADSVPEQEWAESNHKARALAEGLGFSPEQVR